jgi:tRNA (guanine6-N2)-methyltransferase
MTNTFSIVTMPGLETIAFSEVRTRLPQSALSKFSRGTAIFTASDETRNLLDLRLAEDVFIVLAHLTKIGRTQDALRVFHSATQQSAIKQAIDVWRHIRRTGPPHTWRIVSQMEGTHDYRRIDAGKAVSDALRDILPNAMKMVDDESDCEFWIRIQGSEALIGLRISDQTMRHRQYKQEHLPASLRPTVAAAMAWIARPTDKDVILDPMCGVGTILIERELMAPVDSMMGGDINSQAISMAKRNAQSAGIRAEWFVSDARHLSLPQNKINRIITNLPFGKQIGTIPNNTNLYPELVQEFTRVLTTDGLLVSLTSDDRLWEAALVEMGWNITKKIIAVILGQPASIFVAEPPHK